MESWRKSRKERLQLAESKAKGKLDLAEFDIKPTELPEEIKFIDREESQ